MLETQLLRIRIKPGKSAQVADFIQRLHERRISSPEPLPDLDLLSGEGSDGARGPLCRLPVQAPE